METPKIVDGYTQDRYGHKNLALGVVAEAGSVLPTYAHPGDSGFDLRAAESAVINPGERAAVSTGLRFQIPPGHEIQVRPRSGLALNAGLTVLNTPGTVDEGFTGVVKVILLNTGRFPFHVVMGDRIAQAVVAPVVRPVLVQLTALPSTDRGAAGFGSTGAN